MCHPIPQKHDKNHHHDQSFRLAGLRGSSVVFMILGPLMSFLGALVFEVWPYCNADDDKSVFFEMCSDEKHFSRLMPGAGLVAAQIQSRFSIWENDAASYIWSFVDCGWAPFKRVFHVGKDTGILRYDKALCHHDITIMNIWNYDFDWYCLLCDKILPATANTVRCNLRGGIQRNYWTNPRHRCCHHRHCRRHHMVTSSPSSSSSLSWFESKSKSGPTLTAGVVVENHAITNKVKVSK